MRFPITTEGPDAATAMALGVASQARWFRRYLTTLPSRKTPLVPAGVAGAPTNLETVFAYVAGITPINVCHPRRSAPGALTAGNLNLFTHRY